MINKIPIFAVAILVALVMGVGIAVTQNANAMIETTESCKHKVSIRCGTHDLGKGFQDGLFGLIDGLTEPSK